MKVVRRSHNERNCKMDAYAGLDLHGDNVYCGISDENDKRLFEKRFPCDIETISKELEPYRTCLKGVAVESTFNWYWLVDGLKERNFPVRLLSYPHPLSADQFARQQFKGRSPVLSVRGRTRSHDIPGNSRHNTLPGHPRATEQQTHPQRPSHRK